MDSFLLQFKRINLPKVECKVAIKLLGTILIKAIKLATKYLSQYSINNSSKNKCCMRLIKKGAWK
jgi:hypothetical protein